MTTAQPHLKAETGVPPNRAEADIKPQIPQSAAGFRTALKTLSIDLRLNSRTGRIEYKVGHEWDDYITQGWRILTDYAEAKLRVDIELGFSNLSKDKSPWRVSNQRWDTYVNDYVCERMDDPFIVNYLNSSAITKYRPGANGNPDNTDLLDNWLNDLFDWDADPQLVKWASRYCFVGAVQRAMEPGCKLDETLVLIGPQGCGKSSAISSIVPGIKQFEWFTDAIDLGATDKVLAEATDGRVICELGEMAGLTKKELSKVKQWLSRRDDGAVRRVWKKYSEENIRRFICIGTANGACLPNDSTGNRRFVAIETYNKQAKEKPEDYLDVHRDQLFSQALYLYCNDVTANLPYDLRETQDNNNDQYRANDEYTEDIVRRKLEAAEYAPGETFTLSDIVDDMNNDRPTGAPALNSHAVKKAIQICGCVRKRTNRGRFWTNPGVTP